MQVHDAAREATRGQQLEVDPDLVREPAGATADDDRRHELVQLVDEPTVTSCSAVATSLRTAAGSNDRSTLVRGVLGASSVVE